MAQTSYMSLLVIACVLVMSTLASPNFAAESEPLTATIGTSSNWAVLIAGSNGYYNYRHQADVAHAYQILTQMGGFPKENVIVMMYNDIVNNSENPLPGQLFNEPGGHDVYSGINIDYSGEEVTAENFLNVIQGKATTDDKPVLNSGANDNVFIYYTDHGATGIVGMPTGSPLYADDLNKALNNMFQKNMYKQLVFYLEACESGSMFADILTSNISVYATTAANPHESSYAYYFNSTLNTYMADEYSIRWMQDTTNFWNYEYEILLQQFINVQSKVTESHPQKYGDFNFDNETIEDFQAYDDRTSLHSESVSFKKPTIETNKNDANAFNMHKLGFSTVSVDSRDVKLATLYHQFQGATNLIDREYFATMVELEIKERRYADTVFYALVKYLTGYAFEADIRYVMTEHHAPKNFDCLKKAYQTFEDACFKFNDYSLKYVQTLVNLCETYSSDDIFESIRDICE